MAASSRSATGAVTRVPGIDDEGATVRPVLRAVVALALGVGLGALAALFIPRRGSR